MIEMCHLKSVVIFRQTIVRMRKYFNIFSPPTPRFWNSFPAEWYPLTYDLT